MRINLKSALTIILLVAFTNSYSQIKAGYIIGLNRSTLNLKTEGISSTPHMVSGIHYGGILEFNISKHFALRPEIMLSAKGTNYTIDSIDYSLSPVVVEVPVLAVCSFGSEVIKFSLFAGPYFASGMGGYKIVGSGEIQNLKYGTGENADLKRFDIGFNFGAGISIKGMLISAQYGMGLANLSPVTTDNSEMKNKVFGFSISQAFEGK